MKTNYGKVRQMCGGIWVKVQMQLKYGKSTKADVWLMSGNVHNPA